jgi:predicted transcriptional regulator
MKTNYQELRSVYEALISKRYTSLQIANELGTSASSVKRHLILLGLKTVYKDSINIPKEKIEELINQHLSTTEIANILHCSQTTIIYWIRKFGLKSDSTYVNHNRINKEQIESGVKTCPQCKETLKLDKFYIQKNGEIHCWCKKCNDRIALQRQKDIKQKSVEYKGGKCNICGYNRYNGSLDFHHMDPSKKEFSISQLRTYDWEKIKLELDKCICVCRNCHGEIHGGIIKL